MRKFQEANDSVSIEQEQADQVRRTTGATLAARALEEVLPAIGKGYSPQLHRKAAERMSKDMDKPGFTFTVDRYEEDDDETGHRLIVNSNATAHDVGEAASLLEAAPDLYDVSTDLHMNVNSLHATMRATNTEYRGSALCRAMDALIRKNAAARGEGRGG